VELVLAFDQEQDDGDAESDLDGEPTDAPTIAVRASRVEVLRQRDFAHYSPDEFAEARRLMADLRLAGARRRSRRLRASRRDRGRPDLRRTVQRALRTDGEPISRAFLDRSERPRRLVLLCDVSGSMEPYARGLVRFLHAAVVGRGRVEAFAMGTRLTRVTRELSSRDPDAAIAAAARRVADWSGGTRLGEDLRQFNDEWGVRGMARGATVVILSVGWDRGDPELLGEQMARLHRVAHQIVWVNPLKSSPDYAPLARGMAAALPHVDEFVEGHNLASLANLARILAGEKVLMKEVLNDIERWRAGGHRVAVARVVALEGSAPRDPGATMAVSDDGEVAGSVSGGCVEGAVVTAALEILAGERERGVITFGYSDDEAFAVGLTCGGTIHLYVEPLDW
jgi:uncharacterized protein with von Willebrand factor type A (vWA) domain